MYHVIVFSYHPIIEESPPVLRLSVLLAMLLGAHVVAHGDEAGRDDGGGTLVGARGGPGHTVRAAHVRRVELVAADEAGAYEAGRLGRPRQGDNDNVMVPCIRRRETPREEKTPR